MDGLDDGDGDCGGVTAAVSLPREKKRRLRVELVRALERSFEVENKLGPERKVRLAQELGHQPRQVVVWFQKRRARWKTKQLEQRCAPPRLRFAPTATMSLFCLRRVTDSIIEEQKAQLATEETLSFSSVKEESVVSEAPARKEVES
ncbi:hypothetical protein BHE74_00017464 [Ensete ventricosum]|nr:hypothetical protein BHE74_00017464 [Ensete ventricosum]